jgi:hypothetical protein
MGKIKIEVPFACEIPIGYGVAYIDGYRTKAICYPIPLNWIVWFLRELYFLLVVTPQTLDNRYWNQGYNQAVEDMNRDMRIKDERKNKNSI